MDAARSPRSNGNLPSCDCGGNTNTQGILFPLARRVACYPVRRKGKIDDLFWKCANQIVSICVTFGMSLQSNSRHPHNRIFSGRSLPISSSTPGPSENVNFNVIEYHQAIDVTRRMLKALRTQNPLFGVPNFTVFIILATTPG